MYCAHVLLIHRKRSPFPAGEGFFVQLYLLYRFFDSLRRATARSLFFYDFLDSFSTKPWKLNDDNGTWIIVIFIISKLFCQEKRLSRHFFLLFCTKTLPSGFNIIKLRKWQKEDTHNKAEKSRVMCIFLTKKHGEKTGKKSLSKKVLKKERIYGILYRKLAAE